MHWQDRYSARYGFWRAYATDVIYRYLECGDLHVGFARVRCQDCGHEYLLAYSSKRRHFCPSCHQKRVVEFGQWLCSQGLKMFKAEGKISDAVIENMLSPANGAAGCKHWRHSGFNGYCGPTIWPNNDQGLEDLARYIIRACFSQQRMTYVAATDTLDGQAKVIYRSKDGRTSKTFEALDWSRQRATGCKHLLQLVTHIANKGQQMVRYYCA